MSGLIAKARALAAEGARREINRAASYLGAILGEGAIAIDDMRIVVSGRGIAKRWLGDPRLRYLRNHLK